MNKTDMTSIQHKFMHDLINRSKNHKDGWLGKKDIMRFIKMDYISLTLLESINYDLYYPYRDHINKLDLIDKICCYVWWYMEGYHLSKLEHDKSRDYTNKLCRKLRLRLSEVANVIDECIGFN